MKQLVGCFKFAFFAFFMLAIAIGWSGWQANQREKHQAEQKITDTEFARFVGAKAPPSDAVNDVQARYRKGHLLLINGENGLVDEMFYALPPALRAANANDVKTVVWLHWDSHVLGRYSNGGQAIKIDCDVVVYDVARKAIVARENIEGEEPPQTVRQPRGSRVGWAKLPTEKVMQFLQELPTR